MMKKILFILIAIIAMVLGIVVGVKLETKDSKQASSSEILNNINTKNNSLSIENNTEEKNNTLNQADVKSVETEEEVPKTDLEKAIDIVKKDWGKDESVYFAEDGKTTNGEYIIAVRDKNTTRALAWYTVNISTGVFIKE